MNFTVWAILAAWLLFLKCFFFSNCQGQNKYEINVTVGSALKSQVLGCEYLCSINQLYIKLGCQLAKSQSITTCHWIKKRNLVASFRESESKFFWRIPLPARILIKCRQGGRSQITLARFCSFLTNYLTNLVSIYTKLEIKPCGFESRIRDVCS